MKKITFFCFLFFLLNICVYPQTEITVPDYLLNKTQSITINGRPALRILSRDARWIEILSEKKNDEEALVFTVMRLESFGLGVRPQDEGSLYITKTKALYVPNTEKDKGFDVSRSELKDFEMKKMSQGFDAIIFKIGNDKHRFILGGTAFVKGSSVYEKRTVLKPALNFLFDALRNFDDSFAIFNKLTSNR